VTPAPLGSVDERGRFTAGPRSGSGEVTATAGTVAATAWVTVACPVTRSVHGVSFRVTCTASADVYVESRMAASDEADALALVEPDIAAVQRDMGRALGGRTLVYVFADQASYVPGVAFIWGDRTAETAAHAAAFFAPVEDAIAVDWNEARRVAPITALRHELSHRLIWQTAGMQKDRFRDVPAWLDEGLARLEESTVPGASWIGLQDRAFVASMSASRPSLKLAEYDDRAKWNQRDGIDAFYEYLVAAQAVRLLRADIGQQRILDVLERVRDGASFRDAYKSVTRGSFDFFALNVPYRVKTAASLPGAFTADRTPTTLFLYGFSPFSTVKLSFDGAASLERVERMDDYGNAVIWLGDSFPPGDYTLVAQGGLVSHRVTLSFTK
jgi:hypothetical protein